MKRALPWLLVALVVAAFLLASRYLEDDAGPPRRPAGPPQRIASLAPSLTEILFAIGAGSQVVGVSSYTTWPPEAAALPALGGHHDPDLEALVALSPDHIVTMGRLKRVAEHAERLGIPVTELPTDTLEEIFVAIDALGALTQREAEAESLRARLVGGLDAMRARRGEGARPRVLIVVGREPGAIAGVYSVAGDAFLASLLEAAGGRNAVERSERWPQLSLEALVRARPDVILELAPDARDTPGERAERLAIWREALPELPAVRRGAVLLLVDDHILLPGPRILESARALEAALQDAAALPE